MVEFVVVNTTSPYIIIMGRSWIHSMKRILSILHQVMRYVSDKGTVFDIKGRSVGNTEMCKCCFKRSIRDGGGKKLSQIAITGH